MTDRNKYKKLKANLIGKRQEVKRLHKHIVLLNETHKTTLADYHSLVRVYEKECDELRITLAESKRKKWYQFKVIE
jgi:hypothetical protein